jgi:hypothetical protein
MGRFAIGIVAFAIPILWIVMEIQYSKGLIPANAVFAVCSWAHAGWIAIAIISAFPGLFRAVCLTLGMCILLLVVPSGAFQEFSDSLTSLTLAGVMFAFGRKKRNVTNAELPHAPEPAAGPDSKEESSPPAQ